MIAHHLHEPRQLVRVLPQWSGETVPVHAVYPSNRYLSPKVRSFIDLALERLPQAHESARRAIICAPETTSPRSRCASPPKTRPGSTSA